MMKFYVRALLSILLLTSSMPIAKGAGWPANYQGVMLQGFWWDSYNESRWYNLQQQSDELSQYFTLIWIPNSAKSSGGMGYRPVYWFTNHNTSFGTENQLRQMIQTFKSKGTGIIADVVINHRDGVSNWTNFPEETWNGRTWKLGPEHICRNDEVKNQSGQATPTGNYDTGENFDGSRDLDHTNATVQDNCKNYCKCLLEDFGYSGFRLDMVKGYSGQYTKIYNEYSKPTFSVGEYFDGSFDAVASWIEATGRTSAAFDFPLKFKINSAFANNNMTELVWKANGVDQPAGLIHNIYTQYAVTFVDNHDTYRDHNKFNGDVVAANAFILCSPGTPCVFLRHWIDHKEAIKKLIAIRNSCGVHNLSKVNVLQSSRDCYMAEVTGTKGKLVVRIGTSSATPSGYSNSDIKASGTKYCVWTKTQITGGGGGGSTDPVTPPTPNPGTVYTYLKNTSSWGTPYVWAWTSTENCTGGNWPGTPMENMGNNMWRWILPQGKPTPEYIIFSNNGDPKTADLTFVNAKIYDCNGSIVGDAPSGVETVIADDENAPAIYYNLQGQRIDNPANGIFIRVSAGKATKVTM